MTRANKGLLRQWCCLTTPFHRRPRMAQVAPLLARLKRDPIADLPIADHFNQLLRQSNCVWRDRLLTPMLTLRLFLTQILSGNCAISALRQLAGIDFAPSSY